MIANYTSIVGIMHDVVITATLFLGSADFVPLAVTMPIQN